ncbi:MAG: hypothetical protein WCG92_26995, partial [Hyphomicrobiales bacterium]
PLLTARNPLLATIEEQLALRAAIETAGTLEVGAFLQSIAPPRRDIHARALPLLLKAGLIEIDDRAEIANRPGPLT